MPPPQAPFTIAATATDVSAARGSSTATRSCARALPEDLRTFFPAFLARLAHTDPIASLACSNESSRLMGGTMSISPAPDGVAPGTVAESRPRMGLPRVVRIGRTGRARGPRATAATVGAGLTSDDIVFAWFRTRRDEPASREGRAG